MAPIIYNPIIVWCKIKILKVANQNYIVLQVEFP